MRGRARANGRRPRADAVSDSPQGRRARAASRNGRRFIFICCDVQDDREHDFDRLLGSIAGLLEDGTAAPGKVKKDAAARDDADRIGRFMEACTVADPEGRVQATALYAVFVAWAKATDGPVISQTLFGRSLRARGLARFKSGRAFWLGIRLSKRAEKFECAHVSSETDFIHANRTQARRRARHRRAPPPRR